MEHPFTKILNEWNFNLVAFVHGDTIVECRYCGAQVITNTSDGDYSGDTIYEDMVDFACKVADANHRCITQPRRFPS